MAEGERVIEKSKRPDGTVRKEIRVRPGFKSEELDIETRAYQSKGAIRKAELEGYVPGSAPAQEQKKTEAEKRKERRQRKKEATKNGQDGEGDEQDEDIKTQQTPAPAAKVTQAATQVTTTTAKTSAATTPAATSKIQANSTSSVKTSSSSSSSSTKSSTKGTAEVAAQLEKTTLADDAGSEGSAQLRKLQKLLRQITQLEEDLKAGKPLTSEQKAKIARKKEVELQIGSL